MGRNRFAGKHPSYKKRNMSAAGIRKKRAYDKAYGAQSGMIKYRAGLNRINRNKGNYGNGDGKDEAHKEGGGTRMQSYSLNRAGNRMKKGSKPGSKRKCRSGC